MTQVLLVSDESLAQAAALLRAGQVCAFPTETVYGRGAAGAGRRAVQAGDRVHRGGREPPTGPALAAASRGAAALRAATGGAGPRDPIYRYRCARRARCQPGDVGAALCAAGAAGAGA